MKDNQYCLELLEKLVAIPSPSMGEKKAALFLADVLEQLGFAVTLQEVGEDSRNVIARWPGGQAGASSKAGLPGDGGRRIMLGGHLDTVQPNDLWRSDPYQLRAEGDRLYGVGAADMKGGLAAQVAVLKKMKEEGFAFVGEIVFAALADEERYSLGAKALVAHYEAGACEEKPEFAIFGEPHYHDIVIGGIGKVLLRLTTIGSGGHASRPESGISAVDSMIDLMAAVNQRWGDRYRAGCSGSHCILKIESLYRGYGLNIPEQCTVLLNKLLKEGETAESFTGELQALFQELALPGTLKIDREIPYYQPFHSGADNPDLLALMALLKAEFNFTPELRISQSISDANVIVPELGVPTILFGPRGTDLHRENEYVSQESLFSYMTMLESFLRRYFAS